MYASRRTGACAATEMREWNAAFNEARTVEATLRYATFEDAKVATLRSSVVWKK